MVSRARRATPWFIVAGLALGLAALASSPGGPTLGQSTTVRVVSPGTASMGDSVVVRIDIENVTSLGAYEWVLTYDPAILELVEPSPGNPNPQNSGFLVGASCPPPVDPPSPGAVRFGCATTGQTGVSGSSALSFVTFTARANGSSSLCIKYAQLADHLANDIPTGVAHDSIAIGGGLPPKPSCPPPATPTPYIPPVTPTPHGPPGYTPVPTAPPASPTPAGPTPTPEPTPPPEQAEVVDLAELCNPVATTYPDGTTVQTLAAAISPPGILLSMWAFEEGFWLGYSPQYPQASDLAVRGFLDVVFLCVDAPGTFVRPLV